MSRRIPCTGRLRGFTLIELMIAVAVVAILAALALPSYQESVWKSRRGEAKAAILRALQNQERFFTQSNSYLAYSVAPPPGSGFAASSSDSGSAHYTMTAVPCGTDITQCVRVIATVVAGGADPRCGTTLSADSQGNKSSAIANPVCWQ